MLLSHLLRSPFAIVATLAAAVLAADTTNVTAGTVPPPSVKDYPYLLLLHRRQADANSKQPVNTNSPTEIDTFPGVVLTPTQILISDYFLPITTDSDQLSRVDLHAIDGSNPPSAKSDAVPHPTGFKTLVGGLLRDVLSIMTLDQPLNVPGASLKSVPIRFTNSASLEDRAKMLYVGWMPVRDSDTATNLSGVKNIIKESEVIPDEDCQTIATGQDFGLFSPRSSGRFFCTETVMPFTCTEPLIRPKSTLLHKNTTAANSAQGSSDAVMTLAGINLFSSCPINGTRMIDLWAQPMFYLNPISEALNIDKSALMASSLLDSSKPNSSSSNNSNGSSDNNGSSDSEKKGLAPGAIAGIVVGGVAFIALIVIVSILVRRHQKESIQLGIEQTAAIRDLTDQLSKSPVDYNSHHHVPPPQMVFVPVTTNTVGTYVGHHQHHLPANQSDSPVYSNQTLATAENPADLNVNHRPY
ncbi:hypothetical protein GQ42DRAFT_165646 [Ramicandelaber brevisporus]|nr:hypothetical protein GQ42DRAFT_165646 [Ramicandelaber brevisporus]